jgi:uncharacterized membrane protein
LKPKDISLPEGLVLLLLLSSTLVAQVLIQGHATDTLLLAESMAEPKCQRTGFSGLVVDALLVGAVDAGSSGAQLAVTYLGLDKSISYVGDSLTAMCIIINSGGADATGVVATMTTDGLTVPQPTKTVGTLAAGSNQTVTFDLRAVSVGVYTLNVTATASNANAASRTISVNVGSSNWPYIAGMIFILALIIGFSIYWKIIKKPNA